MLAETPDSYRDRIYRGYVTQRDAPLAPQSLAGLAPRLPYLRRLVARYFPQDRSCSVLELGCGYGALLHVLRENGYENVRGVDGSPEQVAAARRLGIGGVEQGDLMAALAATPGGTVDVVVAFDVIEHFRKDELIPLVDAVRRVLKPGGRWIIHAPNGESPFGNRVRYGDLTHEQAFTRTSLSQLLRSSGFVDVECFEDKPIPHGVKSTVRAALWNAIRIVLLGYIAIETGTFDRAAVFSQNLLAVAFTGRD